MRLLVSASVAIALGLLLTAQEPEGKATDKAAEKAAFESELAKAKRETPEEYARTQTMFTFFAEVLLGRLGYDAGPFDGMVDERMQKALRLYQKNRGLPVTGDPSSFETVEQVAADITALDASPVSLPSSYVSISMWDDGYVSAKGTWTISGEQMAWPEQTTQITCYREIAHCVEATAIVSRGFGGPMLSVDTDMYEIERWDEHELVTKPLQMGCTRYVKRFNRTTKVATGIRSTTSQTENCKGIDPAEKHLVLKRGFDVYWPLQQKYRQSARDLLQVSPSVAQVLDAPKAK